MKDEYEIRVITSGMSSGDPTAVVQIVTPKGTINLAPKALQFNADAEDVTTLTLTFFGHEVRLIHTPKAVVR